VSCRLAVPPGRLGQAPGPKQAESQPNSVMRASKSSARPSLACAPRPDADDIPTHCGDRGKYRHHPSAELADHLRHERQPAVYRAALGHRHGNGRGDIVRLCASVRPPSAIRRDDGAYWSNRAGCGSRDAGARGPCWQRWQDVSHVLCVSAGSWRYPDSATMQATGRRGGDRCRRALPRDGGPVRPGDRGSAKSAASRLAQHGGWRDVLSSHQPVMQACWWLYFDAELKPRWNRDRWQPAKAGLVNVARCFSGGSPPTRLLLATALRRHGKAPPASLREGPGRLPERR
jgi:hypothetical protein